MKLPLDEIAAVVRAANRDRPERERVLLCADGVHAFGVEETSPVELGRDLFATGCHKWLFGPRGTGLLWGRPAAWRRLEPTIPSFDGGAYMAWMQGRHRAERAARPTNDPRRLPLVRAPLGALGGARPAHTDRAAANHRAHSQPGGAAQARPGREPARPTADAARRAPVCRAPASSCATSRHATPSRAYAQSTTSFSA